MERIQANTLIWCGFLIPPELSMSMEWHKSGADCTSQQEVTAPLQVSEKVRQHLDTSGEPRRLWGFVTQSDSLVSVLLITDSAFKAKRGINCRETSSSLNRAVLEIIHIYLVWLNPKLVCIIYHILVGLFVWWLARVPNLTLPLRWPLVSFSDFQDE